MAPGSRAVEVRDVRLEDAEAIVGILNPIIEARVHTAFDTPFGVEDERRYIERLPARGIWKVAVREGDHRIVGFQILEPIATYTGAFDHVASIGTYVDLECHRQGIASRLFQASFDAAREKGFEKLFTFVRSDNDAALRTYSRHGFTTIGTARRHARIDGRYIDEILIERALA